MKKPTNGRMGRMLVITLANGETWHVPAHLVATSRADYYAVKVDGHSRDSTEYSSEVKYALSPDGADDLVDWFRNNMNWSDVEKHAKRVKPADPPDMSELLNDADFKVIDGPEAK